MATVITTPNFEPTPQTGADLVDVKTTNMLP